MVRHRVPGYALVALLGLLALGLSGCWNPFAPPPGDPDPDPPNWELRDSPQHVLDNLVTAYRNRAVEQYVDCLAVDFIFWMNPQEVADNPQYLPGYWDLGEERAVHEKMFGDGDLHADRIELTLTLLGNPVAIEPSPGDIHWQYTESVDLRVTIGATEFRANAPSKFEIHIDQDQQGPNGETLWEIANWYDLEQPSRGNVVTDEGTEIISLGRAKAMFQP
jgi:hypothetical protein